MCHMPCNYKYFLTAARVYLDVSHALTSGTRGKGDYPKLAPNAVLSGAMLLLADLMELIPF